MVRCDDAVRRLRLPKIQSTFQPGRPNPQKSRPILTLGQLPNGSGQLSDGSGQLSDGSGQLSDGSGQLSDGSGQLSDDSGQLSDDSGQLSEASGQLSEASGQLSEASGQLSEASGQLSFGKKRSPDFKNRLIYRQLRLWRDLRCLIQSKRMPTGN
jgi:X-X-X-Leu-X-X-Gly heptad repeat protein